MSNIIRPSSTIDFKIVVLGALNVGKTSVINRYINGFFQPETLNTIGAGFFNHIIKIDSFEVNLLLWDTAGEERFKSVAPSLLRGANGVIIVYDISKKSTFEEIDTYYNLFLDNVPVDINNELPILLLGNKIDLEEFEILEEEVQEWCKQNKVTHFSNVSAKDGTNIENSIFLFLKSLLNPNILQDNPIYQISKLPNLNQKNPKNCFC